MAQRRPRPARQDCCRSFLERRHGGATDGVDGAVNAEEAAGFDAALDRVWSHPDREQLRSSHVPMLPDGDLGDLVLYAPLIPHDPQDSTAARPPPQT
jgi:hypothetical protein